MKNYAHLGDEVVSAVRRRMAVDDQWSLDIEGGFKWWGWNTAQQIWSEGPIDDDGIEIYRLHVYADVLKGFEVCEKHLLFLESLGSSLGMSGFIRHSEDESRIRLASVMYLHEDNRAWVEAMFSQVVAMQAAEASMLANNLPDDCPFEPDFTAHPQSGSRKDQDEMLDILSAVINPAGRDASRWIGPEMETCVEMLQSPPCLMATGDHRGLSAEFPFLEGTSLIQLTTGEPNPRFGNGLLSLYRLPAGRRNEKHLTIALKFNEAEVSNFTRCHFLGSWTASEQGLVFTTFYPNFIQRSGLLQNLCMNAMLRASWVTQDVFDYSWAEHFEKAMEEKMEGFLDLFGVEDEE